MWRPRSPHRVISQTLLSLTDSQMLSFGLYLLNLSHLALYSPISTTLSPLLALGHHLLPAATPAYPATLHRDLPPLHNRPWPPLPQTLYDSLLTLGESPRPSLSPTGPFQLHKYSGLFLSSELAHLLLPQLQTYYPLLSVLKY